MSKEKKEGPIARESFDNVVLSCGHKATGHVVTVYPGGKKLYRCKVCGELKSRKHGRTR